MAKRQRLSFSQEDLRILAQERYEHPDPRVQKRMEVLWLISQKVTHHEAARLAGVSRATAERYVAIYRSGGVAASMARTAIRCSNSWPDPSPAHSADSGRCRARLRP